jgi:7,8-dihydropterin-6-yl-methyl-4-(beta-D-ribofuranosyl)aminobenzene 5'-phosphate synthase
MKPEIQITVLVENTSSSPGLSAEHGLSFWIEYADKRIVFDTGQSEMMIENANTLGIDLAAADAIILSHGHYDHTGGLTALLEIAADAEIYLHRAAVEPKYSFSKSPARYIGMPDSAINTINTRKVIWTRSVTQIFPGVTVTGQIPRINDFEDVGGAFFIGAACNKPDELLDDQSLFIESKNGLVVILGCAHSGVVNILDHIADTTKIKKFYAVIGGMHLVNASADRIEHTIETFRRYNVQRIGLAHCTGNKAVDKCMNVFPDRCFTCPVGKVLKF